MVPPSLPVVSLLTLLEAIPGREGVRGPTPPLPTPTHPDHRPPCAPTNGSVSTHTHDTQLRDFFPSAQSPSASSRLLRQETSVSTPPPLLAPPLGLSFTPFSSSLYPLRFIGRLRRVVRSLLLRLFALRFPSAEQICRTTSLRLMGKHRQQTFASLNFESKLCSFFLFTPHCERGKKTHRIVHNIT